MHLRATVSHFIHYQFWQQSNANLDARFKQPSAETATIGTLIEVQRYEYNCLGLEFVGVLM